MFSKSSKKRKSNDAKIHLAPEHLLVIRLSAMGDIAMAVPVISVLTTTYPHLKVTVLTKPFFATLFEHLPNVDVYEADVEGEHNGMFGLCSLAKDLRDFGIEKVADLHDVLRSNVLKSVFFLYGIPVKQIEKGRDEKKALTAADNKVFKQLKSTHQRYADVFSELGYPLNLDNYMPPQKLHLTTEIRAVTGKNSYKWLGIAPFAAHDSKVYPEDLMEQVIASINDTEKVQILLFGGGKIEAAKLEILATKYERVTSVAGKLKFNDELALISNLDAMLSMDSGNAHLAAIYGIPTFTMWGVTHPYAGFKPFRQPMDNCLLPDLTLYPQIPTSVYGNKVPEGYEDVMRSIPPEDVIFKLKEMLLL